MLMIKLILTGRRGQRSNRIVVQERREKRQGNIVEQLGTYGLKPSPSVKVNKERLEYWLKVGAKPTEAVARLLKI